MGTIMLFNSYIFVFVFFPLCLLGYYGLLHWKKPKMAKIFLTIMSLWFYGYFNLSYLLIMVGSIAFNYIFHLLLSKHPDKKLMVLAVTGDLSILFYFKYFDFFLTTVNGVFGSSFALRGILLPLGISFFTFQQISFVADTYRGEVKNCSLIDYALFVSFFPQLIAGPIVNHDEMLPQFRRVGRESAKWEKIAEGFGLFVFGMAKKVLLADTFGQGADYGYDNIALLGRMDAVLVIVFYALQLYFDFSGYCDMARGIGKMLGIEIPVNFDSPYKATNIVAFWKRWHITLNRFFTKYVYIPLGGNRKGAARMYLNLMLVFLLSGLWHGAGWNYIVWGAMHGVLYVATRFWQRQIRGGHIWQTGNEGQNLRKEFAIIDNGVINGVTKKEPALYKIRGRIMTLMSQILLFLYVSIAWVYFRAQDIAQANRLLAAAFQGKVQKISLDLAECFRLDEFWYVLKILHLDNRAYSRYILMAVILAAGLYLAMAGSNAAQRMERVKYRAGSVCILAVLMVWSILTFSGVSTFLYFNF